MHEHERVNSFRFLRRFDELVVFEIAELLDAGVEQEALESEDTGVMERFAHSRLLPNTTPPQKPTST